MDPTWRRIYETLGILTLAIALLVGPSLISVQFGSGELMGPFGKIVGRSLHWALGLAGYVVVLGLLAFAVRIFAGALGRKPETAETSVLWRERIGLALAVFFGAVLLHLSLRPKQIAGVSPGGNLGEVVGEIFCAFLSSPGAWIVTLSGLFLSLILATNFSIVGSVVRLSALSQPLSEAFSELRLRLQERFEDTVDWFSETFRRSDVTAEADGTAVLPPPVVRLDLSEEDPDDRTRKRKRKKKASSDEADMPADLEIGKSPLKPVITRELDDDEGGDEDDVDLSQAETDTPANKKRGRGSKDRKTAGEDGAGLTIVQAQFEHEEAASVDEDGDEKEVDATEGPGFVLYGDTYKLPPTSLLELHENGDNNVDRDLIYEQADRLTKALADYNIEGRVTKVHPGPVVTMYEFVPAPGTRVSKVASLCDDLAMSLHAQRVRIVAPIPGKGAIGIEVPNSAREVVSFREVVSDDAFRNSKTRLALALGKNIFGAPVVVDLAKMPHLLVAGATGAGKSVSINSMICSLLCKCTPEEVQLIMIDPKFLELSDYNDIPHLLLPVVTDPKRANTALRWAVAEMERRYQLLAEMRVRDISTFNRKVDKLRNKARAEAEECAKQPLDNGSINEAAPSQVVVVREGTGGEEIALHGGADGEAEVGASETGDEPIQLEGDNSPVAELSDSQSGDHATRPAAASTAEEDPNLRRLPYIVVVVDEFADLMMVASKEVETSIARLAQKARAAGIHLIVATQRPSVDVITGLIKANFPSRIAFQVASGHDSKTILGSQGAENLLGAGDMLVLDRGVEMKRIHGAFISDSEIQGVTAWVREQGKPIYDMDMLKQVEQDEADENADDDEDQDEMYDKAVSIVAETRQASISMIQRRLRVGYNRAARMVERMERNGIVGPPDGVRGREVLISEH